MNEIIGNKKIDELVSEALAKKQEYAVINCNENNYLLVETQRKELTSYLDYLKGLMNESEQEYLKPYKDFVEPLKNAINELLAVESELKASVLNEKKIAFKEEVKQEFYSLCNIVCMDGVIPDFEQIFEQSWYGKPKKTWKELLLKKITKATIKLERMTAYFVINTDTMQLEEIKTFMNEKNISYSLETVKEN